MNSAKSFIAFAAFLCIFYEFHTSFDIRNESIVVNEVPPSSVQFQINESKYNIRINFHVKKMWGKIFSYIFGMSINK